MKLIPILSIVAPSVFLLAWSGVGPADPSASLSANPSQATQELVAQGEYIVHQVAQCVQCHSPRNAAGQLRQDRLLSGGQIPFTSPWKGSRWAELAPNLKQMLGYTDAEAMQLLTQGRKRNGERPRGPMPQFGMKDADARAVIAYLRSL